MHSYKYYLLFIVVILFGCSIYSKGSIEKEWDHLRWTQDVKMSQSSQFYLFSVPSDGESYVFECMNSKLLKIGTIVIDNETVSLSNDNKYVDKWGQIKIKNNKVYVWMNPAEGKMIPHLKVEISSRGCSTNFYFEPEK